MTAKDHAPRLVAVVDDDESVRSALTAALQSIGILALGFNSAESFMDFERLPDVGCLITDYKMPGMNGLQLQAKLRDDDRQIPIVFMTAHGAAEARTQALAAGAVAFLDKPFDDNHLLETVRTILAG